MDNDIVLADRVSLAEINTWESALHANHVDATAGTTLGPTAGGKLFAIATC